ncbi:MAG: hypothetical protein CK424_06240 [Legionella sp.]|nr:MAG: hypothetical protein CK424_06240 [Legionella sp.]
MIKNNIIIEDTTLRDGEQAPGLAFNKKVKIDIYRALVDIGVQWLEVGIPAMGGEELEAIKCIKDMAINDNVTAIAWNRGVLDDVAFSISLGFKAVHIGLPTSNVHLKNSIQKDRTWLLNKAKELINYAKNKDVYVSISAEDVGRTEISFLQDYACVVEEAGADRLRLSDTIGVLYPKKYQKIIRAIKKVSSIPLQSHAHNDFGLAVANTLAALDAGAQYFHVTVNGIGERAGMPDFAQVIVALRQLHQIDLGIDLSKLTRLGHLVANYSNAPLYPWHPITGTNVFAHESGIHANGTLRHSTTFEPFDADIVGGERKIVIGKHSGKNAIQHTLEHENIEVDESLLDICLKEVRKKSMLKNTSLTMSELIDIYRHLSEKEMLSY